MVVQCNQTGKTHKVKIASLSQEDLEQLKASDLTRGSQIMMEYNKKSYPVTVQKVISDSLADCECCLVC